MADIVIHCPSKVHKRPVQKEIDGRIVERIPNPKILFIASPDSIGQFKIQCGDHRCVSEGNNRGWYEVTLNGCGGYVVRPISKAEIQRRFNLNQVPYAMQESE